MLAARQVLSILFGASFTVAVMWALGCFLFRKLDIRLNRLEHDLLAAATGGALLSFVVFLLCVAGLARTPVFLVFGLAALAVGWNPRKAGKALLSIPRLWRWVFLVPFVFYALVYLASSVAPEYSPDGQTYHLGLVFRLYREHGFHRLTTNMYANISLGFEMLFLFAFAFGRQSAAATVHCAYLLALAMLILCYGRRIGRPYAGVCAALIVFLSPVAGIDGSSAYNDVALAATGFALFYLLEVWRENHEDGLLIPIGLLAGFCFAIKYTGFIAPVYAAAVIGWRRRWKALLPVALACAAMALPWLIKNWVWTGDPVAPFADRTFPNPYFHVAFEDFYRRWFSRYDLPDLKTWAWSVIVTGRQVGGQLGPVFLLTPLALFALRSRAGRHVLLAAMFFLVPYPWNVGARFLLPAAPFLAMAIALALDFSKTVLAVLVASAALLAWPGIIRRYDGPGNLRLQKPEWRAALRIRPQDDFLNAKSTMWGVAQLLNHSVARGQRVLSTAAVAESYTDVDVLVAYQSAEGDLLEDILTNATRDDLAPTWNLRFTFPRREVRHLRMVQTAPAIKPLNAGDMLMDEWSIGEIRIFDGDRSIARAPAWRLDATPFPWDIGLAFDNNPATRWKSWQRMYSGMHVDVDFGAPLAIDRVELHCSHDQPRVEIHPESCDGAVCAPIPARREKVDDPPAGDFRRIATRTVKERGIEYLLIDPTNWTAADMKNDPARWGMDFIAERAGYRLYRLK